MEPPPKLGIGTIFISALAEGLILPKYMSEV